MKKEFDYNKNMENLDYNNIYNEESLIFIDNKTDSYNYKYNNNQYIDNNINKQYKEFKEKSFNSYILTQINYLFK